MRPLCQRVRKPYPLICCRCGGMHLGGEPLHEVTAVYDDVTEIERYCIECIDLYSQMMWNREDWGPYDSRMQHRREIGHA